MNLLRILGGALLVVLIIGYFRTSLPKPKNDNSLIVLQQHLEQAAEETKRNKMKHPKFVFILKN
ncbi:hypothetical protein [Paraflavitalea speifideaquila]|uniref:hypothetical protein n=1 Tax=Paraflavitalea speifideaquila TaxID=3076558 RepID=UPI0028E808DF|nr:hypothetical protein [Paraflavitalea speifideiaquila]